VDGKKQLSPEARLKLVKRLKLTRKSKPTRRIWIPKPGTQEKRPLGIPTIDDRALQSLVKLVLEPEWEAKFEPNSYGFRPGRSTHDAIGAIFDAIKHKSKYVLDADIAKCFDRIDHSKLLAKLNTSPTLRRQIRAWLKSGVIDDKKLFPTKEGTPQGGICSPLLANIALHGMEQRIKQAFPKKEKRIKGKRTYINPAHLIRFADDFVVLHEDLEVVKQCQKIISEWLKELGLELKPSKTRISHTLHQHDGNKGFKFLGFSIRQFPVGKYQSGKNTNGEQLGFKTLIKPSKDNIKEHRKKIKRIINVHKASTQLKLIDELNPIITGWSKYFSTVVSSDAYSLLNNWMYQQLRNWAVHRHPHKSQYWISNKYWLIDKGNGWRFAANDKDSIKKISLHSETSIVRHIKVQGNKSPFDGDWVYWSKRMGQHPEANKRISLLLKKQKGKCPHCELYFKEDDLMEIDHIIPRSQGGKDEYSNFQLLHRHCHDEKTAVDLAAKEACVTSTKILRSRMK